MSYLHHWHELLCGPVLWPAEGDALAQAGAALGLLGAAAAGAEQHDLAELAFGRADRRYAWPGQPGPHDFAGWADALEQALEDLGPMLEPLLADMAQECARRLRAAAGLCPGCAERPAAGAGC